MSKLCETCTQPITAREKLCDECKRVRANASRRFLVYEAGKQALEELRDMDSPMRLDKVVDLAVRIAT